MQGVAADLPVRLEIDRHDGAVEAGFAVAVRVGDLAAVPAVVQEEGAFRFRDEPVHGGEDVGADGVVGAGAAGLGHDDHVAWVCVVAARHEEGDHVVDVGFAASELVGGVKVVYADEEGFSTAGHSGRSLTLLTVL